MRKYLLHFCLIALLVFPFYASASSLLASRLAGRILLQAEAKGEAWYVDPVSLTRYYLGRPADAFSLMRSRGLGITNDDLRRVGVDTAFTRRLSGRILLQVESHGEAWYVDPSDRQGHYLGRPADAFSLMRRFGLGISDADLAQIPAGQALPEPAAAEATKTPAVQIQGSAPLDLARIEFLARELVNQERANAGLKPLVLNGEVAAEARAHSQALADENRAFTGIGRSCDYPLIYHEGLRGAAYNSDRLEAAGLPYFNKSGENIALVSAVGVNVRFAAGDPVEAKLVACEGERAELDQAFRSGLEGQSSKEGKIAFVGAELDMRAALFAETAAVTVAKEDWHDEQAIARETVAGWMASPGHKRNILDAEFDEAGLGAAYVNGYAILTQSFIRRASCGYRGGPCCSESDYYPYCYSPLTCRNEVCGE